MCACVYIFHGYVCVCVYSSLPQKQPYLEIKSVDDSRTPESIAGKRRQTRLRWIWRSCWWEAEMRRKCVRTPPVCTTALGLLCTCLCALEYRGTRVQAHRSPFSFHHGGPRNQAEAARPHQQDRVVGLGISGALR